METDWIAVVLRGRSQVLEKLATGASLEEILLELTLFAEQALPNLRCSVLILDEKKESLSHLAAPSLPAFYKNAIDGVRIGPEVGSCGTAVYHRARVVVEDVLAHSSWSAYRDVAKKAGIRACWSQPIFSATQEILGTFAMYYPWPRAPEPFELDFIQTSAHLAGIAIERTRSDESLRRGEERFRQLAESIREVFWLTDWDNREVLYVSPAYETVWGRSCQSLYDDPKSWAANIHRDDVDRVVRAFEEQARGMTFDEEYRLTRDDGTIRWIHDRAFPIYDRHGKVYRLAGISEDITARKTTELQLEETRKELDRRVQKQLQSMASELLLAEERERSRLATDLHDGLSQFVALTQMKLANLRHLADSSLSPTIQEIEELVDKVNQTTRSLTYQLSPPILHDLGFEPAVHWLVDDIRKVYGLDIMLTEEGGHTPLDDRVRLLLFRAVRELLINVAKHSAASWAYVKLTRETNRLRIAVEDDGNAFDLSAVGVRGIGLFSIRERLCNLGGRMDIQSEPGRGTKVTLYAPLRHDSTHAPSPAVPRTVQTVHHPPE